VIAALGRDEVVLTLGGRRIRLGRRHSELLVLLLCHPEGRTGDQLGLDLYHDDQNPVTVRAELSRLRRIIGPALLDSRPYRLRADLDADFRIVGRLLESGRMAEALAAYTGPLLPSSDAPGVSRLRRYKSSGIGRENHKMMLDHYQQTKNPLVSYSTKAMGHFWAMATRVDVTSAAAELIRSLRSIHGPLMFHQSGDCCDGSSPTCYPQGEFRTGASDVLLASLEVPGVPEPVGWRSRGIRPRLRSLTVAVCELSSSARSVTPRCSRSRTST
jgi:hypothetical protein